MNSKTPQYTKDAINKYNAKFDRIAVNLPKGTKDRIKEITGKSCNAYINELVLQDLEQREKLDNMTVVSIKKSLQSENQNIDQTILAAGLPELPEDRKKAIKEKLDAQIADTEKRKEEKQTPKKDNFSETLERLKKDNNAGKLVLNIRENI